MSSSGHRLSSGLVHLTRLHSTRAYSDGSIISSTDLSSRQSRRDSYELHDKNWSWKHLRDEFKTKDSEKLFHKYQARLHHTFFMVSLIINIFFNGIAILIYFFDKEPEVFPGPAIMRIAALFVFIPFLVLTCMDEQWLRPPFARNTAAISVLIAMIFAEHGGALYAIAGDEETYSLQRIRPTYYLILSSHVFLPFTSRLHSCISTSLIVLLELTLTIVTRISSDCSASSVYKYAFADLIFYSVGAIIGFVFTFLLEIANRRAFLDHRHCVESTFKLDYEQEQQDQLLNSCLPKHLCERVRKDMREVISTLEQHQEIPSKPFNELYVEKHKNVSILYADIVNSMLMAAKLKPSEFAETLNDLYSKFDEMAEKNNCLRIKFLGDCYYCVSGVPSYDEHHAVNCVQMGLDMIRTIRSVREDRQVDVDMRIGVHTGMVLSGLLGVHKWQYDIWSKDCMTAAAMEHNGVPGLVHVTAKTLDHIKPVDRASFNIKERRNEDGEVTYLISKRESGFRSLSASPVIRKKGQTERQMMKLKRPSSYDTIWTNKRKTVLETSLRKYREMVKSVNEFLDTEIDNMPLGKKAQWFNPQGINPICLNFTRKMAEDVENIHPDADSKLGSLWSIEKKFILQPDPLFRYYLYSSGGICLAIVLIKAVVPRMEMPLRLRWSLCATLLLVLGSLLYTYYTKRRLSCVSRLILWMVISFALILCGTVDMVTDHCFKDYDTQPLIGCAFAWYYTFCLILAMTGISLFIRINLWFKLAFHITITIVYILLSKSECSVLTILDKKVKWKFLGYAPHVGHLYYIITVAFLLHMIDRQIEYIFRLDFRWTSRLEIERHEAEIMGSINSILLQNILPLHVAERFLCNSSSDQLYHESYESIAVMFASIPNYVDFYTETNINEDGLKCLQLLNEIICDFDKLLSQHSFERIEKIKTIGSTYMVAAGLEPGRGSTDSDVCLEDVNLNVMSIIIFGASLMETLQRINKDALQDVKLRIGISVGPVIAGIVGSTKPQYDIWGDTVNVASRMESTGITGRIHVTKEVAATLNTLEWAYTLECRGPILVKGKGELVTYLVVTPFDSQKEDTVCSKVTLKES